MMRVVNAAERATEKAVAAGGSALRYVMLLFVLDGIAYPLMRVDTPDIRFGGAYDAPFKRYAWRLAVMTNIPETHDYRIENKTLADMEALIWAVYGKIVKDAYHNRFDLIGDPDGTPIRRWSGDNCFGWQISFTLEVLIGWEDCCNE